MDWPTAAVLIAVVIAVMAVLTTYIAARLEEVDGASLKQGCEMSESTTKYGILVAVDGSAESDAAVRWATREAVMRDAPVTLMHVVAPVVVSWPVAPLQASFDEWQEENAQHVIEQAQKTFHASLGDAEPPAVRTEVRHAPVASRSSVRPERRR